MTKVRPSPALVISLIALFVALGGTSYAAINSLPKNSVGTKQLKNGAVTAKKLSTALQNSSRNDVQYDSTLPAGKTEVGEWGGGGTEGADGGGATVQDVVAFPIPLASGLNGSHTIFVSGSSATHCAGAGHAAPGYLCVYAGSTLDAEAPDSGNIYNPETGNGPPGTGVNGFGIYLAASSEGAWGIGGTYAVTAP